MRILGIDPGSLICGWAVVECRKGTILSVEYDVVNLKQSGHSLYRRISDLYRELDDIIRRTKIDAAAFESLFYSKNVQSLIKLTHARAASILAASLRDIPVFEYSPREVKKAVTGNGNAAKEQVQYMVRTILNIEEKPHFYDASDALAVAICHSIRSGGPLEAAGNWKDFIAQNPRRVVRF